MVGNSNKFTLIVIQVQTALNAWGYEVGTVDGQVGVSTKAAILQMQKDWALPVTGTITPEVLNALGITAE